MQEFTTRFLNPFVKEEIVKNLVNGESVLQIFNVIPWYKYIKNSFEAAISCEEITINEFWYLSIEHNKNNKLFVLLIVPNFASSDTFSESDIRFSIEYFRPKMIKTCKINQFFGGAKEKLKEDYSSYSKDLTLNTTFKIISNFTKLEHKALESKLITQGPFMYHSLDLLN